MNAYIGWEAFSDNVTVGRKDIELMCKTEGVESVGESKKPLNPVESAAAEEDMPEVIDSVPVDWPEVLDRSIGEITDVIRTGQQQKHEVTTANLGIDKGILTVFAIAFLGSLLFMFYMISIDKLESVTAVLYPIITAILGFMGGYFAGTGRRPNRGD